MTIFILTMWLYAHDTPLIIAAFESRVACEQARPEYDRPYSWAVCQSLTVLDDGVAQ